MSTQDNAQAYWSDNLRIIITYLSIWFVVSYVCGILLVDQLGCNSVFRFPIGVLD